MTTEAEKFNLSNYIENHTTLGLTCISTKLIKEFIRLLKEGIIMSIERKEGKYEWISIINKLAGEKLT